MRASFTVLYDASVLYPASLRSLLMYLGLSDLFRARWTEEIHDEWIRSLLRNRPELSAAALTRTRQLMNMHMEGAIIHGYENLIPSITLPDPDDRHVLAAAIYGRVDLIVTYNLNDFPATELNRYGIEAQHPDEFLAHLFDLNPHAVIGAVRQQRSKLQNPPVSPSELLALMERLQLPITVRNLRNYIDVLCSSEILHSFGVHRSRDPRGSKISIIQASCSAHIT